MRLGALMEAYAASVKDIAVILLIIAGAGALKEVFRRQRCRQPDLRGDCSGLPGESIDPWLVHRRGTARCRWVRPPVAGLTAAGIMAPVVAASAGVDPNLMVLAIGAGSLMFSHVNDSGFWMAKEYFNLTLKETVMSWTLMEGIVGFVGIAGVFSPSMLRTLHSGHLRGLPAKSAPPPSRW